MAALVCGHEAAVPVDAVDAVDAAPSDASDASDPRPARALPRYLHCEACRDEDSALARLLEIGRKAGVL